MKRKLSCTAVLAACMVASSTLASASNQRPLPCLAGMRAALVQGHFTGLLVCPRVDATFDLVGRTTGNKFSIYDYRYRYLPAGGNVMHGGQKIVIFRNNTYVGQYALPPPPYITATVSGTHVILQNTSAMEKVELDLSDKPPRQILINGDVEIFFR